ncbi:MAG: hypothetical protein ACC707_20860, partial [Thiohalomonadales bacterium]
NGGLLSKIYSGVKIVPGANMAKNAVDMVLNKADKATKAADDLLTSQSFRKTIDDAVKGKSSSIEKAPIYKRWLNTLTPKQKTRIASIGFVEWLTEKNNTINQNQKVK